MNILFFASWYPTDKNPNFGVFIKEHAHAIKKAGNDIVVLAFVISKSTNNYSQSVTNFVDNEGIITVLIEIKSKYSDYLNHLIPLQFILLKKYYKRYIKPNFTPDIIHSNVIFPAGILGQKLSSFLKIPHVITEHWSRVNGFLNIPVLGKLAVESYLTARAILPVSNFLKKKILMLIPTLDSSKVIPVPNVIDTTTFSFKSKVPSSETIRFVAVATWNNKKIPDKIPELFIEALGRLQVEISQKIQLTMIGGGDKVLQLKELCFKNNIDAIFTGYQNKMVIANYLQEADFFVHASTIETFGVVVAEALLCGTPVICSNVGALPELINETNGVLCENDAESWLFALKAAINKEFNQQKISNNIKYDFNPLSVGQRITTIYKDILN